jgi:uncharacterized protein YcbK (DUF882 family)
VSGHHKPLPFRLKTLATASVLFAACASLSWGLLAERTVAAGETRTLSLYHVHTRESLVITYKRNGRYLPSALEKINYIMRDWRKNQSTVIDPMIVDLMWELHADLGSKSPIHIICGYRAASTNAMLKKIGRNVAKQSMHIRGKAIDLYFPDVAVAKIRGSAIVRQVGGVGYYPRSGASGFVHIDTGNVRYWPRPDATQMAEIFRDYRKTVGARMTNGYMVAQADPGPDAVIKKHTATVQTAAAVFDSEDEAAESAATSGIRAKPKAEVKLASAEAPPRPRSRPIEVMFLASMQVEPASAPAPRVNFAKRSPQFEALGDINAGSDVLDVELSPTNTTAKGSLAGFATASTTSFAASPGMRAPENSAWWLVRWLFDTDSLIRRNNSQEPLDITYASASGEIPAQTTVLEDGIGRYLAATETGDGGNDQVMSGGKSDMLIVNRSAKGDNLDRASLDYDQLGSASDVLDGAAGPLSFE